VDIDGIKEMFGDGTLDLFRKKMQIMTFLSMYTSNSLFLRNVIFHN
jgi:hypothetical protein